MIRRLVLSVMLLPLANCPALLAEPYQDDPEILKIIAALPANTGAYLPATKAVHGDKEVTPPRARDYSNKMPYMEDRHTAFYCGGGHAHRRHNDAWEYHLGSNTWHLLFPDEGGDQGKHKPAWFIMGRLAKDPFAKLTEKEQQQVAALREWWKEHMVLRDGYMQTTRGGGFMTSHTWDGITYDPLAKKLLWGGGHHKDDDWKIHAMFMDDYTPEKHDEFLTKVQAQMRHEELSNMWYFDFAKGRWVRQSNEGYKPLTSGGGATMHYIPELKQSLYHSAIYRRSGTALYDAVNNKWTEIKPNGLSVGQLLKEELAPRAEQQVAYSSKHQKLVAVLGDATYAYDVKKNEWQKLTTDPLNEAHNARTVFDYDSKNDRFLLLYPKKNLLRAYSLQTNQWETLKPRGEPFQTGRWDPGRGYYDPRLNAFVCIQNERCWVYRYGP